MNIKNIILTLALVDLTVHYTLLTCILLALIFLWNSLERVTQVEIKISFNRYYLICRDYLVDKYNNLRTYYTTKEEVEVNLVDLEELEKKDAVGYSLEHIYDGHPEKSRLIAAHNAYCPDISLYNKFIMEDYKEMLKIASQIKLDLAQNPDMVSQYGTDFLNVVKVVEEFQQEC